MIFALTETGNTVFIISPWLNMHTTLDVLWRPVSTKISFLDLVKSEKSRGVNSKFFVSTKAKADPETQSSMKVLISEGFQVEEVKELHSKAIIGSNLMYEGSANITQSGLYNNKESATISTVESQEIELRRIIS